MSERVQMGRDGSIDVVRLLGEHDIATIGEVDAAVQRALSDETRSVMVDVSGADFIDSSVIRALIRWSNEAQVSEREALAIVVGPPDSRVARTLALAGVAGRLAVFESADAARAVLVEGRKARPERPFGWLSDRQLEVQRTEALAEAKDHQSLAGREEASIRLGDTVREQRYRRAQAAAAGDGERDRERG